MDHDVIIIGGSYAGQSAALQLARARRDILVIDAGERRNRHAAHSHGFLGQDGRPPGDIAADSRAQLLRYETVQWQDARVVAAHAIDGGFRVVLEDGGARTACRIILAAGVRDELPDVAGLAERWGRYVFHCPYCHGYELLKGKIGVLAISELSLHQALMLPDWGPTTLFLNDAFKPDAAQRAQLQARGVQEEAGGVARLDGDCRVVMHNGRVFDLAGLFVATRLHPSALAAQLGCALEAGPLGEYVATDGTKASTVPGVFACGDVARAAGNVALAVGDGAMAGAAAHRSLMFGL